MENKKIKLNLGCGDKLKQGYINLDFCKELKPNIVHNLNNFPWPFKKNEAEEIIAEDVYEHVYDPVAFMNECWRIMEVDGILTIRTSCWNTMQSFTDPTHKRFLTQHSFDYFDKSTIFGKKYWWYSKYKWKIIENRKDGQELVFRLKKVKQKNSKEE